MTVALLRLGVRVVLTSTDQESLDSTIREAAVEPGRAVTVTGDVSQEETLADIVATAERAFRRIDMLVNNAGVDLNPSQIRFWELPADLIRRQFGINSSAPQILAGMVVPGMVQRGWGRIVNVTTSLNTMLRLLPYGGSKAALEAHTASMAADLAGTGVTANVLIPGGASATRMSEGLGVPASALIQPEVMAAPIVWLASDASNDVTARRFIAAKWDPSLPADEAARIAGAPVAWTGFGEQSIRLPGREASRR
jgi:3-oxoacyl-[acyl-carrier protein] reductase